MTIVSEFVPTVDDNEFKVVPMYKAKRIIDLKSGQVFYSGSDSKTKLTILEHSKTGKSVTYKAENGFNSMMKANTIVWVME